MYAPMRSRSPAAQQTSHLLLCPTPRRARPNRAQTRLQIARTDRNNPHHRLVQSARQTVERLGGARRSTEVADRPQQLDRQVIDQVRQIGSRVTPSLELREHIVETHPAEVRPIAKGFR